MKTIINRVYRLVFTNSWTDISMAKYLSAQAYKNLTRIYFMSEKSNKKKTCSDLNSFIRLILSYICLLLSMYTYLFMLLIYSILCILSFGVVIKSTVLVL